MIKELFDAGYQHGLVSTKLTDFRLSFRTGFRKAQIERRQELRTMGVYCYPRQRIKIVAR